MNRYEFIWKAIQKHGYKYDYREVDANVTYKTKVMLICDIHGIFHINVAKHLCNKQGCRKCGYINVSNKKKKSLEYYIDLSNKVHHNKYDYTLIDNYIDSRHNLPIICPEHGIFKQAFYNHIQGHGCPKCANNIKFTTEDFIKKAKKIHEDKYDYSKVIYNGCDRLVDIICPKHGLFKQIPYLHLIGQGCPKCRETKLEKEVRTILDKYNIKYVYQFSSKWLNRQRLDFYLPDLNIAIECQGEQHFAPIDFAGKGKIWAKQQLLNNQIRDKLKYNKCKDNNIKLLYYGNKKYSDKLLNDKELIEEIYE